MPSVQAKSLAHLVNPVRRQDLRQPGVRRAKHLVLLRLAILEVVGTAEIILRAGPADGRELPIAVHKKLDFALAPPTGTVHLPRQVGAHVMSLAGDAVEDGIEALLF